MTGFYMFRLYVLAFRGPSGLSHEAEHHLHESPPAMIAPVVVLAALSVVGGWVGLPFQAGGHLLERWLRPVFEANPVGEALGEHAAAGGHAIHALGAGVEWLLIVISIAVAAVGIALAFRAYLQKPDLATSLQARFAGVHRALLHKYWVDEVYDALVVSPIYRLSRRLWTFWDEKIVDGAVNGVAAVVEGASVVLRLVQTGFVGTYALFITLGVAALILHYLRS